MVKYWYGFVLLEYVKFVVCPIFMIDDDDCGGVCMCKYT